MEKTFMLQQLIHSFIPSCVCLPLADCQPGFSARFFLVVVEFTQMGRSLLHMWHLLLDARPVTMGRCRETRQEDTAVKTQNTPKT